MATFELQSKIDTTADELFAWHERAGGFQRLAPPWQDVELLEHIGGLEEGSHTEFHVKAGPFRRRWFAQHFDCDRPHRFRDRQLKGPFSSWVHTHQMTPEGESCMLNDHIDYVLPFGILGRVIARHWMHGQLDRAFQYRHRVTNSDISNHQKYQRQAMKILIGGSSGLVGKQLVAYLSGAGHQVIRLVRQQANDENSIVWDPVQETIDSDAFEGIDAVIHLGGENIAGGRWTKKRKALIYDSRINSTTFLAKTIANLPSPPKTFITASAIGYYGDRGDEVLNEDSKAGEMYLSEVCHDWEQATQAAADKGVRVVNARIGVVLSPAGGALKEMLLPFQLCVGGIVGNGRQYWSWIALDDVLGAIEHILHTDDLSGPVNVVSPNSATNREFTKSLGKVLRRPTIFPMPAFAARTVLGEMADELLLASALVKPTKLQDTAFEFGYPELELALRHVLGR